jgi:protein-S-isoprenylcysteine O-methyltransferase Ste14
VSAEFWAIIGVGVALVYIKVVAAQETEKRLNRIIELLSKRE